MRILRAVRFLAAQRISRPEIEFSTNREVKTMKMLTCSLLFVSIIFLFTDGVCAMDDLQPLDPIVLLKEAYDMIREDDANPAWTRPALLMHDGYLTSRISNIKNKEREICRDYLYTRIAIAFAHHKYMRHAREILKEIEKSEKHALSEQLIHVVNGEIAVDLFKNDKQVAARRWISQVQEKNKGLARTYYISRLLTQTEDEIGEKINEELKYQCRFFDDPTNQSYSKLLVKFGEYDRLIDEMKATQYEPQIKYEHLLRIGSYIEDRKVKARFIYEMKSALLNLREKQYTNGSDLVGMYDTAIKAGFPEIVPDIIHLIKMKMDNVTYNEKAPESELLRIYGRTKNNTELDKMIEKYMERPDAIQFWPTPFFGYIDSERYDEALEFLSIVPENLEKNAFRLNCGTGSEYYDWMLQKAVDIIIEKKHYQDAETLLESYASVPIKVYSYVKIADALDSDGNSQEAVRFRTETDRLLETTVENYNTGPETSPFPSPYFKLMRYYISSKNFEEAYNKSRYTFLDINRPYFTRGGVLFVLAILEHRSGNREKAERLLREAEKISREEAENDVMLQCLEKTVDLLEKVIHDIPESTDKINLDPERFVERTSKLQYESTVLPAKIAHYIKSHQYEEALKISENYPSLIDRAHIRIEIALSLPPKKAQEE